MFFPGNIYPEYLNKYAGEDSHDKPYAKSYAEVIRSQMTWQLSNKGRVSPATWTKDFLYQGAQKKMGQQLSFDEWIICQDYFIGTIPAEYRSMCDQNYPADCLDETKGLHATDQCPPPALWKKDNMWSPRRGHQALVHRTFGEGGEWGVGKLYVLGGRAREFARVDDERMVGGVVGSKVATDLEHITIREETLLKNDIWVSEDGLGKNWELVTPGCRDPQVDILLKFEVWSRDKDDNAFPKNVGAKPFKDCKTYADCYGQAVCINLQGMHDTCACPMWSPREHHSAAVQHIFSKDEFNNTQHSEDYMYVVGGFVSVRKSFCGDHSCGSSNSYRYYMDDAWVSNDALNWVQFKESFDAEKR